MDSTEEFEKWRHSEYETEWDIAQDLPYNYDELKTAFTAGIRLGMERSAKLVADYSNDQRLDRAGVCNKIASAIRGEIEE